MLLNFQLHHLLRHPVYGLDQIPNHLIGGAVPFGALLDEVLQEDRVYPPDGGEDVVRLLDDVGVGYVALLDHLLDPPDVALHALEPAYHLAFGLFLQAATSPCLRSPPVAPRPQWRRGRERPLQAGAGPSRDPCRPPRPRHPLLPPPARAGSPSACRARRGSVRDPTQPRLPRLSWRGPPSTRRPS